MSGASRPGGLYTLGPRSPCPRERAGISQRTISGPVGPVLLVSHLQVSAPVTEGLRVPIDLAAACSATRVLRETPALSTERTGVPRETVSRVVEDGLLGKSRVDQTELEASGVERHGDQ